MFALVGCAGGDCPVGTPNSACFLGDNGTVVDYSADVALATTTDLATLDIESAGRLVFGPGTYRVTVYFSEPGSLAIEGAGAEATVLAGTRAESTFTGSVIPVISAVSQATALDVSNLLIEDGAAITGGAIYADQPGQSVTIRNVTMRDNVALGSNTYGGAVFAMGTLVVEDSRFETNEGANGGAIYTEGPSLTIVRSHFEGNSAGTGGAVMSLGERVEVRDCVFFDNDASDGGAMYLQGTVIDTKIDATIERTELRSNRADAGGAIMIGHGTATMTDLELTANGASSGGALYMFDATATLTSSRLTGSQATCCDDNAPLIGGAVLLRSAELTVDRSDIAGNRARKGGGAVALQRDGDRGAVLVVAQSTFGLNEGATFDAPDIANLQLEGSTFSPDGFVSFRCDLDGCR